MAAATKVDREIEILFKDGRRERVAGIPSNAKITYGPVSPGARDYNSGNALRIYTTQNNQLAVFVNVETFRDLSLTVKREKVKIEDEAEHEDGPKGKRSKRDYRESREWEQVTF